MGAGTPQASLSIPTYWEMEDGGHSREGTYRSRGRGRKPQKFARLGSYQPLQVDPSCREQPGPRSCPPRHPMSSG